MSKYQITPSEGVSQAEALEEFNSEYTKIDDLYKNINSFPEEISGKIKAKVFADLDMSLKKKMEALGLDFEEKNTKKNIEAINAYFESQIAAKEEELQAAIKGGDKSEEIENYKAKIATLTDLNKDLKTKIKEKESEVETIKGEFTQKEKQSIIKIKKQQALSDLKIVSDAITKKALEYDMSQLEFDLDEEGAEIVKINGQVLKSTLNAGALASYREAIEKIAEDNKALEKAPIAGVYNPPAGGQEPERKNKAAF